MQFDWIWHKQNRTYFLSGDSHFTVFQLILVWQGWEFIFLPEALFCCQTMTKWRGRNKITFSVINSTTPNWGRNHSMPKTFSAQKMAQSRFTGYCCFHCERKWLSMVNFHFSLSWLPNLHYSAPLEDGRKKSFSLDFQIRVRVQNCFFSGLIFANCCPMF